MVGVVISYYGDEGVDVRGLDFKHGNIVARGHKGVWAEPLGPGKCPLNTYILRLEHVPTTNLVLNWANARSEAHQLDKHLFTMTVRSKDGFPFNLDVSQIIQEARQNLEKQTAIADIQKQIIQADQGVQIAEIIGKDKVKVMPDILITGGGSDSNGALSGLLGMKLMEELGGKVTPPPVSPVVVKPLEPLS